ncbi:MAG TPA: hypothetical protein VJN69_03740 [Candidatus Acidoferrales bacterium]|nr:hypothetical protein [Candidatus Acidoferrales bacterium]
MNLPQNSKRAQPATACSRLVRRRELGDSGYAYIMALFMVLTVIIGSQVVLRNMVTVSRSQREAQAIWRGNQYARAIKMYYRKTGHFPTSQDDLLTGVPGMHFLRSEVMKDPMNNQEGTWRFIYTNASGAIIGSVKYGSMQQMALMDMNGGQMPSTQQSNGNGSSNGLMGLGSSTSTTTSSNSTNSTNGGFSLPSMGGTSTTGTGRGGSTLGPLGQPVTGTTTMGPAPTGPVSGTVFGGQLIGVGSTVDRASVRVYKGGTKYNEWEFIWNPIEEQARAIQQGLGGVTGASGAGGIPGLGLPIAPIGGGTPVPTAPGGSANPTSGPSGNSNTPGDANSPGGSNTNPSNPSQ